MSCLHGNEPLCLTEVLGVVLTLSTKQESLTVRCQHMALLPAASHAHGPCQPALPICRGTGAGADMTQSPSTEHPSSLPHLRPCVRPVPHAASDCHQHQAVQGPAQHPCLLRGGGGGLKSPLFPSLHPKAEWAGSCWVVREVPGTPEETACLSTPHGSCDCLAR